MFFKKIFGARLTWQHSTRPLHHHLKKVPLADVWHVLLAARHSRRRAPIQWIVFIQLNAINRIHSYIRYLIPWPFFVEMTIRYPPLGKLKILHKMCFVTKSSPISKSSLPLIILPITDSLYEEKIYCHEELILYCSNGVEARYECVLTANPWKSHP